MPGGMTRLELAARVRGEKPDLKVVVSSGYNPEVTEADSLAARGMGYLPKPFGLARLSSVIRDCLDSD